MEHLGISLDLGSHEKVTEMLSEAFTISNKAENL